MAEIEMVSASVLPSISSLVSCSPTAAPSTGIAFPITGIAFAAFLVFAFALFVLHNRKITSGSTGSTAGQCEAAAGLPANTNLELAEQENPVAVA
jgi:hypothetical protein